MEIIKGYLGWTFVRCKIQKNWFEGFKSWRLNIQKKVGPVYLDPFLRIGSSPEIIPVNTFAIFCFATMVLTWVTNMLEGNMHLTYSINNTYTYYLIHFKGHFSWQHDTPMGAVRNYGTVTWHTLSPWSTKGAHPTLQLFLFHLGTQRKTVPHSTFVVGCSGLFMCARVLPFFFNFLFPTSRSFFVGCPVVHPFLPDSFRLWLIFASCLFGICW